MNSIPGKYYFQQRQRNRLYEAVVKIVEDAARLDGKKKKDLAEKIGISPSQISRWLSGPSNWTIDSISDVLWALGGELDFDFVRFADRAKSNRSHPINDVAVGSYPQRNAATSTANYMIFPQSIDKSTTKFSFANE